MKTLTEKIRVMQAAEAGKEIEIIRVNAPYKDDWHFTDSPAFDWANFDYRIKTEPMELWVNVFEDGSTWPFESKVEAEHARDVCYGTPKTIKFREVVDER